MGKGKSQTTTSVPQYVEDAGRRAIGSAERIEQLGYTPFYGPDVAAFAPQQMAAFQNTNDMAQAFGMGGGAVNMPAPQNFNGMQGYSSAPIYEAALAELQRRNPEQYQRLQAPELQPLPQSGGGMGGKGGNKPGGNAQPQQILTGPDGQEYTMSPVPRQSSPFMK